MDHTLVDANKVKSLEEYAILLASGLISLVTLQNIQVKAIKEGIMPEDMNERANTIIWDIRRQINMYQQQLNTTLELLPEDFNSVPIIERLKAVEFKKLKERKKK